MYIQYEYHVQELDDTHYYKYVSFFKYLKYIHVVNVLKDSKLFILLIFQKFFI